MPAERATRGLLTLWSLADRISPPRRSSRKRAALIARLEGTEFASEATRAARAIPGSHPRFDWDAEGALYTVQDGAARHAFAHPSRVGYYLRGLEARGKQLSGEYLLDHVPFEDGDAVVDVGANVGDLLLALAHRGVTRPDLLALEPSPREFAALSANLAASEAQRGARAENLAAWSESAEALTFYLKSGSADSSLLPPADYDETIEVPTRALSELMEDRPYKLLKLEAEGAEPEILDGLGDAVRRFEFIAADVGFERGVRQDSTLPEVVNRLTDRGFRIRAVGRNRLVILFERTGAE